MDNKICFLFGQSTAPVEVVELIEKAAERHYLKLGIRTFIVGSRGSFDSYSAIAIKRLKKKYADITLLLLLAYHPAVCSVALPDGFDNSYYPPLETVPKRLAIVKANQYMALSFTWLSPSAEPVVKESQTALISFETQPMLTLNAIDGSVVSRQLGY